jgi:two-component system, LytTR family, response regulator
MTKSILIDDEQVNSNILSEILKQYCPTVALCGMADDIDKAEQLIQDIQPDLIFLDIQMNGGSGFDLLDRLQGKKIEVIFVTAYDNFLLKAIRYSALDYIMKPINIPDLISAVKRAEERVFKQAVNGQLELLLSNIKQPSPIQRIAIPYKDEYIFVPISDIVRLEAKGAYTEIFVSSKKSYLVSRNIKEYEDTLPQTTFCRVHHAHLINLEYIKTYHKGRGGYIEMLSGDTIEVSVRRKEDFLNRFR